MNAVAYYGDGSQLSGVSFDAYTNVYPPISTTGTWAANNSDINAFINHTRKMNSNSGSIENGSGNAATADYNVPTGMKTLFIQHMCYNDGKYFDILGTSDNTNYYLMKRINNYCPDTYFTMVIEPISLLMQAPLSRIRIKTTASSGNIRIAGLAWGMYHVPTSGSGGCGYIHPDQVRPA